MTTISMRSILIASSGESFRRVIPLTPGSAIGTFRETKVYQYRAIVQGN